MGFLGVSKFVIVRAYSRLNGQKCGNECGNNMGNLTALSIKTAKPGRHADGGGLYLFVKSNGARSWVLRVQHAGQRRDIGLGGVEFASGSERRKSDVSGGAIGDDLKIMERASLTLGEAREKAMLLRRVAKAGRDPVTERDKDRASFPTFAVAMTKTHEALGGSLSQKEADAFLASLRQHVIPTLGRRRIDVIDANDIATVLEGIWETKPQIARKVRHRIAKVLDYAKARQWRASGAPGKELSLLLGKQKKGGHHPAMPHADVPAYFRELSGDSQTVGRLALLFIITTAARSKEVRGARWCQFDLQNKLWHRPASLMKNEIPHTVTLNAESLVILERAAQLRKTTDAEAFVFSRKGHTLMSDMTISKIMRVSKLPFVPHGFRSSFRDWAAELMPHIPDAVAEVALSHVIPDEVVKAYKRTNFLDLRRTLLTEWGKYLSHDPAQQA